MSIAGATASILRLLQRRLGETGGLDGYTVATLTARQVQAGPRNRVGLVPYRVEIDRSARQANPPLPSPAGPAHGVPALDLHILLAVWGTESVEAEQVMLGRCVAILDAHPVIEGPLLSPDHAWAPGARLQVVAESLGMADALGLWQAFAGPPQLSVPYLLRLAAPAAAPS